MSKPRDPSTGRYTYQNESNMYLRAILATKRREPILSRDNDTALPAGDTNDLLRQITSATSINTRRDSLRRTLNTTHNPAISEERPAPPTYSLDDLLRQIVAGADNQEETR